ncbi:hypothetical protein LY625_03730 [Lysobacter sp. GX 14042]|uniref:hypothetical protein n=1 Tax=Lysobacter sp. GX 14042 TaxID=2907155 RepID=UPI001F3833F9|nr:hypothetical protein [Lysobacter sp. GX 14042]MCE7031734.1 hypothetical protein [Lysobacter sp. GX 14042]
MAQSALDTRRRNQFAQLASQAYSTPAAGQNALLGQMAAISPEGAQAQQAQFQGQDDRSRAQVINASRYLMNAFKSGDQAAIQGAYRAVKPAFQQLAPDKQLPDQVGEDILPMLHQVLAQADPNAAGTTVQSRFVGQDGNVYTVMRDGQVVNTGIAADRQMWFRDHPGMDPQLVDKLGNVQTVGGQAGGPAPPVASTAPTRAGMEADIALANDLIAAGMPADQVDTFLSQRGARVGGEPTITPGLPTPPRTMARPSEAQVAAETERARQQAQLEFLPAQQAIETAGEVDRTRQVGEVKRDLEKSAGESKARLSLDQATARIGRVDALVNSIMPRINNWTAGTIGSIADAIPGTPAADLRRDLGTLQAIAGFDELNAMRAASPTGGALGNVTERELAFLQSVVRNIENSQSPEQLRRNLQDFHRELRGSWERVARAYDQDYGAGRQPSPQTPQQPAQDIDALLEMYR